MSWRKYFHFNKGQQRGLLSLIVILLLLVGIDISLYYRSVPKLSLTDNNFRMEINDFAASLQKREKRSYVQSFQKTFPQKYSEKEKSSKQQAELFPFDPNVLDSAGFVRLGLKSFMVRNILKYRSKGGKFRTADDFSKIYALSSEQFARLKPYIQIEAETFPVNEKKQQESISFIADLNTADTTELKKVRGISPGVARQIFYYRKRLGGFVSHEQLLEIRYFTSEKLERLRPFLTVSGSPFRKIEVNRASVDFMMNHPYINFYQARAIYEYRRNNGKIKSEEELRNIKDKSLSDAFWEKIMPYIAL